MSNDTYTLEIAGIKRVLKKFPVSDKLDIAAFIMFGDVELTENVPPLFLKKALSLILFLLLRQKVFRLLMK